MNKRKITFKTNNRSVAHDEPVSGKQEDVEDEQSMLLPQQQQSDINDDDQNSQMMQYPDDEGVAMGREGSVAAAASSFIASLRAVQKSPTFYYGFGAFVYVSYSLVSFLLLSVIWLSYQEGECVIY